MKLPSLEASATAGDAVPSPESVVLKKFRHLSELLLQPAWEDGPPKGQRSAMLFIEGSVVKLLLKVEQQKLKAMLSARSVDEVLAFADALLSKGDVPWEQEQDRPPSRPRK